MYPLVVIECTPSTSGKINSQICLLLYRLEEGGEMGGWGGKGEQEQISEFSSIFFPSFAESFV